MGTFACRLFHHTARSVYVPATGDDQSMNVYMHNWTIPEQCAREYVDTSSWSNETGMK